MTYSFAKSTRKTLYTPEQRIRRDATKWTLVQGILAPLQFLVFAISLLLVLRFLATGHGYDVATLSILIKSLLLFTIMVTGAIWEKVVFGQYLFAPAFFWEDVFSFAVIALHGLYLWALWSQALAATELMLLALAAYTAYVINAGQFLWKLRRARLDLAPILNVDSTPQGVCWPTLPPRLYINFLDLGSGAATCFKPCMASELPPRPFARPCSRAWSGLSLRWAERLGPCCKWLECPSRLPNLQ